MRSANCRHCAYAYSVYKLCSVYTYAQCLPIIYTRGNVYVHSVYRLFTGFRFCNVFKYTQAPHIDMVFVHANFYTCTSRVCRTYVHAYAYTRVCGHPNMYTRTCAYAYMSVFPSLPLSVTPSAGEPVAEIVWHCSIGRGKNGIQRRRVPPAPVYFRRRGGPTGLGPPRPTVGSRAPAGPLARGPSGGGGGRPIQVLDALRRVK